MTRRIVMDSLNVGYFVAARAGTIFNPAADHSIGMVEARDDGSEFVRGGVIYTDFTGTSIWMHSAGDDTNWVTPTFLWAIFHYPFVQLGVKRVYGVAEVTNGRMRRIHRRMGFTDLTILPDLFASGPGMVVTMTPESCKWLALQPRTLRSGGSSHGEEGRLSGSA